MMQDGADHQRGQQPARPRRVILYGAGSARWREALDPASGVWDGVPGVSEVVFAERFSDLLRQGWGEGRRSIVLPLRRRALQRFPRLWWNLAPSRFAHDSCVDKLRFDRFMRTAGMAGMVPASWREPAECRFPCVIKRFDKDGSFGVRVVGSMDELTATLAAKPFRRRPVLFQDLVEGLIDHATHCVAVDGRIVWQTSYAYDIDPTTRVQTTADHAGRRRIVASATVLAQFERVLAAFRYSGPVSFDWRPRGEGAVLFEINPRFGGSLMLDINRDDLRAGLTAVVQHARPPEWLPGSRG
jgi:hypothetical protein